MRDLQHLGQLVADERHRQPRRGQSSQSRKETAHLLRDEDRGGFVEDQHPAVTGERFEDLDPLLFADRKVRHPGIGPHPDSEALGGLVHLLPGGIQIDQHSLRAAEGQVFGHGHRVHQREVLGDHPDPGGDGIPGRADRDRLAIDHDLPLVGAGQAIEDPHQRGFPGAVLAENPVHLTGPEAQIDRVVGDQSRRSVW